MRSSAVLAGQQAKEPAAKKSKVYTAFKDSQRAQIGRYAAENGYAAPLRIFRQEIRDLGERTVRLFKKRYLGFGVNVYSVEFCSNYRYQGNLLVGH